MRVVWVGTVRVENSAMRVNCRSAGAAAVQKRNEYPPGSRSVPSSAVTAPERITITDSPAEKGVEGVRVTGIKQAGGRWTP